MKVDREVETEDLVAQPANTRPRPHPAALHMALTTGLIDSSHQTHGSS